jgi:DivIVA domain-containing protein
MPAHHFRFRTRWSGYDRIEVNRFLDQVAADRQFLKDKLNYLEATIAKHGGRLSDGTSTVIEREADEVSAKAALDAQRVQFSRLKDLNRELAGCLNASALVLQKVYDLLAPETGTPVAQSEWDVSAAGPASPPASSESTRATPFTRRLAYVSLAVLAVGGAVVTAVAHAPASVRRASPPVAPQQILLAPKPEAAVPAASVAETPATQGPEESASTADKALVVIIAASNTCWVRSVVDGSRPVERLMQPGDTILVWGRDEVVVRAGDGSALTVMINGQAAVPLGRAGQAVTRRITRAKPKLSVQEQA